MAVRPGSRLCSIVGTAEIVVVRAPENDVVLECGGQPMVPADEPAAPAVSTGDVDPEMAVLLGKRYQHEDLGLEVLCVKAGDGPLVVDGSRLTVKGAKPLPSSD